jgi:hypothetical protein
VITETERSNSIGLVSGLLVGAAVAAGLGVYGNVHDPARSSLVTLIFTNTINLKVWLATMAFTLACFQLFTALRIYGRIGKPPTPRWMPSAHRVSGTTAFWLTIPVAYHCLWSLGFQADQPRVLVHSTLGCAFFGALAAKVLFVRSRRLPDWALPVAGGLVFTALVAIWVTSSLWFFVNVDFPGF